MPLQDIQNYVVSEGDAFSKQLSRSILGMTDQDLVDDNSGNDAGANANDSAAASILQTECQPVEVVVTTTSPATPPHSPPMCVSSEVVSDQVAVDTSSTRLLPYMAPEQYLGDQTTPHRKDSRSNKRNPPLSTLLCDTDSPSVHLSQESPPPTPPLVVVPAPLFPSLPPTPPASLSSPSPTQPAFTAPQTHKFKAGTKDIQIGDISHTVNKKKNKRSHKKAAPDHVPKTVQAPVKPKKTAVSATVMVPKNEDDVTPQHPQKMDVDPQPADEQDMDGDDDPEYDHAADEAASQKLEGSEFCSSSSSSSSSSSCSTCSDNSDHEPSANEMEFLARTKEKTPKARRGSGGKNMKIIRALAEAGGAPDETDDDEPSAAPVSQPPKKTKRKVKSRQSVPTISEASSSSSNSNISSSDENDEDPTPSRKSLPPLKPAKSAGTQATSVRPPPVTEANSLIPSFSSKVSHKERARQMDEFIKRADKLPLSAFMENAFQYKMEQDDDLEPKIKPEPYQSCLTSTDEDDSDNQYKDKDDGSDPFSSSEYSDDEPEVAKDKRKRRQERDAIKTKRFSQNLYLLRKRTKAVANSAVQRIMEIEEPSEFPKCERSIVDSVYEQNEYLLTVNHFKVAAFEDHSELTTYPEVNFTKKPVNTSEYIYHPKENLVSLVDLEDELVTEKFQQDNTVEDRCRVELIKDPCTLLHRWSTSRLPNACDFTLHTVNNSQLCSSQYRFVMGAVPTEHQAFAKFFMECNGRPRVPKIKM